MYVLKATSKRTIQKTAKATGNLAGNKIGEKITKAASMTTRDDSSKLPAQIDARSVQPIGIPKQNYMHKYITRMEYQEIINVPHSTNNQDKIMR